MVVVAFLASSDSLRRGLAAGHDPRSFYVVMVTDPLMFAAIVAVTAFVGAPALGADMLLKAPAAAPPPAFSWTGFYLGGFAGGAGTRSVSNPDATNPGTVGPFPPGTPVTGCNFGAGPGLTPGCFASYGLKRSFIGGGTAGYNWEFGKLVTGIEGSMDICTSKGPVSCPLSAVLPVGARPIRAMCSFLHRPGIGLPPLPAVWA